MSELTVVTYNIRNAQGLDDQVDLRRIAGVLQAIDADIVCLQEIEARMPRSRGVHQARWLADMLGLHARFGPTFGIWPFPQFGNAILTRATNYSTWNKRLPSRGEPRKLLHAAIRTIEAPVHVLCTHWGLNAAMRLRQAETVARAVRKLSGKDEQPVILCGDFNAPISSPELQHLLVKSELSMGVGAKDATFPSSHPDVQIDFVLSAGRARVVETFVLNTPASDHLPLVARVQVG